jgi:L-erythrulose 1-phosphate isomerase
MFYIGTSFKMNKTRREARAYAEALRNAPLSKEDAVQFFVIPAFTAIESFREAAGDLPVWTGAQNCGPAASGAFTGEVSAAMIAELGCDLVELGHSERRAMFGETDAMIAAKVRLVLDCGMRPLICLGESAEQRAVGLALETITAQAHAAIGALSAIDRGRCLLAYEPVWAIGIHGKPARIPDILPIHHVLKQAYPAVPVLYGGSVDLTNAALFASEDAVDGLFIGRAALDPAAFVAMARQAVAARNLPGRRP